MRTCYSVSCRQRSTVMTHVCEFVCACVCVSIRSCRPISKTTRSNFIKISVHIAYGRGSGSSSVTFLRRCDTLCTSGFVDDIIFHVMDPMAAFRFRRNVTAAYSRAKRPYCVVITGAKTTLWCKECMLGSCRVGLYPRPTDRRMDRQSISHSGRPPRGIAVE